MCERKIVQVAVVLGRKPDGPGLHPEFLNRCERAISFLKNAPEHENIVIISGGKTVKGLPSEARTGEEYLKNRMLSAKAKTTFIIEEESFSTSENILFSKRLLTEKHIVPDVLVIFGSKRQVPKVRLLLWRLWKNRPQNTICVSCLDTTRFWYKCLYIGVTSLISVADPYDVFFLRRLRKTNHKLGTKGGA